jgi:hypothetical protein
MIENFRHFDVGPDPFGRNWHVDFRWLQTGISIRHADTVDCKFQLERGEDVHEKVIALPLPDLLALCERTKKPISDPWCMKMAAIHLKRMIETDADMDKTLVTMSLEDIERANAELDAMQPVTH